MIDKLLGLLAQNKRLLEKADTKEIQSFVTIHLFIIKGSTGSHSVKIFSDGTINCSCPAFSMKNTICSHVLKALKEIASRNGEAEVKEIIKNYLCQTKETKG